MSHQDWTPVVLRKEIKAKPKTEHALAAAKAKGQIETVKKETHSTGTVIDARKLDDNESADFKHQTIPLEFRQALMKARQAKGWAQKDLAQKINAKPSIINEYESGKAIPNPQIISQLNRILGVVLPKIPKKKVVEDTD